MPYDDEARMMGSDVMARVRSTPEMGDRGGSAWDVSRLRALLREQVPAGRGVLLCVAVPELAAHAVYEIVRTRPAFCWQPANSTTVVGWGQAALLSAAGPSRFLAIKDQAQALGADFGVIALSLDEHGLLDGARRPLLEPRVFGGFAFQPGGTQHDVWRGFLDAQFVLPRWRYTATRGKAEIALTLGARDLGDDTACENWLNELRQWHAELHALALQSSNGHATAPPTGTSGVDSSRPWVAQIEEILAAIQAGQCSKVVLAQQTQLNFTAPLSVSATLATLHERCGGEATVFAFDFAHGCFLGATPETLLRKQGLALHSEALAGSAQAQDAEAERALLSSSKDREEHRVVVQAIAEALGPLCDEIEFEDEPGIRRLRHLLHLHTPITAELSASCHVLDLVARLHPTPAVGGAPTHWAVRWIAEHESVPRGWYAGPIGWFNAAGDGEFDVALRSGVIHGQEANLYAGAGIVAGSDAQHERAETELKLASLWDALRTA